MPTTMYLSNTATVESQPSVQGGREKRMTIIGKPKFQPFCPYCNNKDHFLGTCPKVKFSPSELRTWKEKNDRCYRCARCHRPDKCTLKKPCNICNELHLTILHSFARQLATHPQSPENSATADISQCLNVLTRTPCINDTLYIDQPNRSSQVMLKVIPVFLINGQQRLQTYTILDDGSERTIILTSAASQLLLKGPKEILNLRHEVIPMSGDTISCHISPVSQRKKKIRFPIANAFPAPVLNLAEHSCCASDLQREYSHLQGLPLPDFVHAQPLILIGFFTCWCPKGLSALDLIHSYCPGMGCPRPIQCLVSISSFRCTSFVHSL